MVKYNAAGRTLVFPGERMNEMTVIRKCTAVLVSLMTLVTPVLAEETPTMDPQETEEPEEEVYAVDLETDYAVLIELGSGAVLFEKQGDEPGDPASLVKIMTVLLAAEQLPDEDNLTMSSAAFQSYSHDQGVLWIQQGETLSVKDCEYASMLASANDTCAMLAEGAAGDIPSFVKKMNERASEIGLRNTHFENPFGTSAAGQYSTAYDLALLTRAAMKNNRFQTIFGASSYTLNPTNMQPQSRPIANDCELLRSGAYQYENALGGKIGSTPANGYALAACAEKGATGLIGVVMHEGTAEAAYRDVEALFEFGFENAQTITITPEDIGTRTVTVNEGKRHVADVVFSADSSFSILMPKGMDAERITSEIVVQNENSTDPERITANVVFLLDGEEVDSAPLTATIIREPEKEPLNYFELAQKSFDIASVALLAFVVLRPAGKFIFHRLQPPK